MVYLASILALKRRSNSDSDFLKNVQQYFSPSGTEASIEAIDISSTWLSGAAKQTSKSLVVGSLPTGVSSSAALSLYGQIIIFGGTTTAPESPNSNVYILDPAKNYSVTTLPSQISLSFDKATFAGITSKLSFFHSKIALIHFYNFITSYLL